MNNMNRLRKIGFFSLLLIGLSSYGQSPYSVVSAPALEKQAAVNLMKTTEIVTNSAQTLNETRKTVDNLQKALDAVEKVSNYLLDVNDTYEIIKIQTEAVKKINEVASGLGSKYKYIPGESKSGFLQVLKDMSADISKQASLTKKLLTSGVFKMNDAERMKFLKDIKTEVSRIRDNAYVFETNLKSLDRDYKEIMD